ncbi:geranylgeranyl reductase family [Marinobacter daqiaonensis]|uniref:Geranylgeranyl reductase family n=1 Tax=Marinobacter daqiaonensis TaxID=650891 RepID=A0A1I6JTM2_9GAMM|nr:NAD(P)/FAD-dependent oxidoreductase [Marinobacter daqiaonensis]SFR82329.1 geranylgeranyl reductase family [Marinobacter daqiaonensis]
MDYYDLIIVGAGPAGSTLAWALQNTGKRILLIDKARFPRDKSCAGWITPAVLDALQIDPDDYARNHVLEPIRGFRIGMIGNNAVENDHGENVSYGIRRNEFDRYLLDRAGTDQALGTEITDIGHGNGNWIINDRWETPLLIGAGGHFCPVARYLGAGPGSHETTVAAKEMEFEMTPEQAGDCQARGDRPELWFCRDLKGYAWIFRKQNYLSVGLGREDPTRLSRHLEKFVANMQSQGRIPANLPGRFKDHAYLLYDHAERPLVDDGIMLIGDAAGLAFNQSGEGIRPAVESALIAANVIRSEPDLSARSLQPYGEAIAQRFGTRSMSADPALQVPDWVKMPLAASLMKSHWFTRRIVAERWFLHRQVPPLELPAPSRVGRETAYWRPA